MRRVAAELGLGTMSLYHYVRGKDELLDLMSDAILGGQLVDDAELRKGWRAGLRAIAFATRANFERHPWIIGAMRPRPRAIPGPNSLRHFDQSVAAVADTGLDVQTRMEIIALIDDYVFGFVLRASIAAFEAREEEAEPGWMQAVFDYMAGELETGAYPNVARLVEANRARGRPRRGPRGDGARRGPLRARASSACSTASRSSSSARRLSGVVEDDAERRAPARAHRGHPVAHVRPVVAARALHRAVAGREDQEGAALEVDDVRA